MSRAVPHLWSYLLAHAPPNPLPGDVALRLKDCLWESRDTASRKQVVDLFLSIGRRQGSGQG